MSSETVIACNLNAIDPAQRDQHGQKVREVFAAVQEQKELPTGYAFRLPADSTLLIKTAEFIANERLCCPFFEFSLRVEANGGPIWLQLAGSEEIKAFLKEEFASVLNQ